MQITRHAYVNTSSQAGMPERIEFDSDQVIQAYVWINYYGNPSYSLYLNDGRCLFCVDDYGCMNDIKVYAKPVQRKKDLF